MAAPMGRRQRFEGNIMNRPRTLRGWVTPRSGLLTAAVAGLLAASVPLTSAQSAADPNCPAPVPMRNIGDGMAVHGLTVTSGTTPDTFQGEVLGVLDDGIAPGLDMIMVQLSGAQITDADGNVDKGIWSGMSGSPVYADNGRLIGAVAYGLSWSPSDVAGVTPAADMVKLLNAQAGSPQRQAAADAKRVDIPARVAEQLVASADLTEAQADSGFQRLPMPFSVSGLSNQHLQKAANRFDIKRRLVAGGATNAAAPTDIVPGGNLAASLSYGDITFAGMGTATAVCNEEVLAFGHPMLWSGRSTMSMHGGNAIYIQRDAIFGSFKVANVSIPPVGMINNDRLAGIHGVLSQFPETTEVTSRVVSIPNDNSRRGKTQISQRGYTPYISALHLLANADRVVDKIGSGSAKLTWQADGTRADGSAWHYSRTNRFASTRDITYASIWESYQQLSQILSNKFERVDITNVHFNAVYDRYHALEIAKFEIRLGGEWHTILRHRPALNVRAGTDVPVRVTLEDSRSTSSQTIRLMVRVPKSAQHTEAVLDVSGGDSRYSRGDGVKASTFEELLANLSTAPRNNELTATLFTESGRRGEIADVDRQVVDDVVSGSKHIHLNVR
jgi:hypothetical protein